MPRLIDADVLFSTHLIWNAPTVDAVQVVRCKDCRWWCTDCMPEEFGWCDATVNRSTVEDWYCADGERKDDA